MVEKNIQLEEEPEEEFCLLVPARRRNGKAIRELDFNLIVDLVNRRKDYIRQVDQNRNMEMLFIMWRSEMVKNRWHDYHRFCARVEIRVWDRRRRSWRYQGMKPEDRPKNEIPLTIQAGKELYLKLKMSDTKREYLKQKYSDAMEKAYTQGFSSTVMAAAIGIKESTLRKEMQRHMEWYGLAKVRHHTPKYIWERK